MPLPSLNIHGDTNNTANTASLNEQILARNPKDRIPSCGCFFYCKHYDIVMATDEQRHDINAVCKHLPWKPRGAFIHTDIRTLFTCQHGERMEVYDIDRPAERFSTPAIVDFITPSVITIGHDDLFENDTVPEDLHQVLLYSLDNNSDRISNILYSRGITEKPITARELVYQYRDALSHTYHNNSFMRFNLTDLKTQLLRVHMQLSYNCKNYCAHGHIYKTADICDSRERQARIAYCARENGQRYTLPVLRAIPEAPKAQRAQSKALDKPVDPNEYATYIILGSLGGLVIIIIAVIVGFVVHNRVTQSLRDNALRLAAQRRALIYDTVRISDLEADENAANNVDNVELVDMDEDSNMVDESTDYVSYEEDDVAEARV